MPTWEANCSVGLLGSITVSRRWGLNGCDPVRRPIRSSSLTEVSGWLVDGRHRHSTGLSIFASANLGSYLGV